MSVIISKKRPLMGRQSGVTLIELMIGITVALIIMAGVISVFVNISVSGTNTIRSTRLNQELRSTMDFMVRELQKAGYSNAWVDATKKLDESIINDFGAVTIAKVSDGAVCASGIACDCILYTYDLNENGVLEDGSGGTENEYFGFRLGVGPGGALGTVEMKTSNGAAGCNSGTWEDITDEELNIAALSFTFDDNDDFYYEIRDASGTVSQDSGNADSICEAGATCLYRRKLNISIDAELANDSEVNASYRSEIKLVNDRYFEK